MGAKTVVVVEIKEAQPFARGFEQCVAPPFKSSNIPSTENCKSSRGRGRYSCKVNSSKPSINLVELKSRTADQSFRGLSGRTLVDRNKNYDHPCRLFHSDSHHLPDRSLSDDPRSQHSDSESHARAIIVPSSRRTGHYCRGFPSHIASARGSSTR